MSNELKLYIFLAGLILIPILVQHGTWFYRYLVNRAEKKILPIYGIPPAIYIIFFTDLGEGIAEKLILSVGYIVFFRSYAAALAALEERNNEAN